MGENVGGLICKFADDTNIGGVVGSEELPEDPARYRLVRIMSSEMAIRVYSRKM